MRAITNWEEFDMATQNVSKDLIATQEEAIRRFFLRHTKREIIEEGVKRGLNACVINNATDILANPQLEARDYWASIGDNNNRSLKYPRFFFLSNQTENFVKTAAPVVGEYNDMVYKKELKLSNREIFRFGEIRCYLRNLLRKTWNNQHYTV